MKLLLVRVTHHAPSTLKLIVSILGAMIVAMCIEYGIIYLLHRM